MCTTGSTTQGGAWPGCACVDLCVCRIDCRSVGRAGESRGREFSSGAGRERAASRGQSRVQEAADRRPPSTSTSAAVKGEESAAMTVPATQPMSQGARAISLGRHRECHSAHSWRCPCSCRWHAPGREGGSPGAGRGGQGPPFCRGVPQARGRSSAGARPPSGGRVPALPELGALHRGAPGAPAAWGVPRHRVQRLVRAAGRPGLLPRLGKRDPAAVGGRVGGARLPAGHRRPHKRRRRRGRRRAVVQGVGPALGGEPRPGASGVLPPRRAPHARARCSSRLPPLACRTSTAPGRRWCTTAT